LLKLLSYFAVHFCSTIVFAVADADTAVASHAIQLLNSQPPSMRSSLYSCHCKNAIAERFLIM
jgi:hypothetical protein